MHTEMFTGKSIKYTMTKTPTVSSVLDDMVVDMKNSGNYSGWTDDEIRSYAYIKYRYSVTNRITGIYKGLNSNPEKPSDSFWNQYTYEEILKMKQEGANVPEEFVEWATAMANADVANYEISAGSPDNLQEADLMSDISSTDDNTSVAKSKKLQQVTTSAENQSEKISEKQTELGSESEKISEKQNELEIKLNAEKQKVETYSNEFKKCDEKVKRGEQLSDSELKRYKELGNILNEESQNLIVNTNNFEKDMDKFFDDVNELNKDLEVSNKLESNLTTLSTAYTGDTYKTGARYAPIRPMAVINSSMYLSMVTGNISNESGKTALTVDMSNSAANIDLNIAQSIKQSVSKTREQSDDLVSQTNDIPTENSEEVSENPQNTEKTENSENSENSENAENTVTNGNSAEAENPENSQTAENAAEAELTTEQPVQENSEENQLQEYITQANEKIAQNDAFEESFSGITQNISGMKDTSDEAEDKFNSEFETKMTEFEQHLSSIKNKSEVSSDDVSKYQNLSGEINSLTDDYVSETQKNISALDGFSNQYSSGQATVTENIEFGSMMTEAGRNYEAKLNNVNPSENTEETNVLQERVEQSITNEVIQTGENLIAKAEATGMTLSTEEDLASFASEKSSALNSSVIQTQSRLNQTEQEFMTEFEAKNNSGNTVSKKSVARTQIAEENNAEDNITADEQAAKIDNNEDSINNITNENNTLQSRAKTLQNKADSIINNTPAIEGQNNDTTANELDNVNEQAAQISRKAADNDSKAQNEQNAGKIANEKIEDNVIEQTSAKQSEQEKVKQENQNISINTTRNIRRTTSEQPPSVEDAISIEDNSSAKVGAELEKISEKTNLEKPATQDDLQAKTETTDIENAVNPNSDIMSDNNNSVDNKVTEQISSAKTVSETNPNIPEESPSAALNVSRSVQKEVSAAVIQSTADETSQKIIQDAVAEVMQSVLSEANSNVQQEDTKKDSRQKMFTRFEQQKQNAIRKAVQKINKVRDAR